MDRFYSQFGEDRALAFIFARRTRGTCIEVGANDGINDSNSYHFEQAGWTCVLVEANPQLCEHIRESRQSILFECAASDSKGVVTLNIARGKNRSHGVSSIASVPGSVDRIESFGFDVSPVVVESRPLDDMLEEAGISPNFEFATIDVEGYESVVLEGFDLDKWRPEIVILEDNEGMAGTNGLGKMSASGYVLALRTGVNDWYIRRDGKVLRSWRFRFIKGAVQSRQFAVRLYRKVRSALRNLVPAQGKSGVE